MDVFVTIVLLIIGIVLLANSIVKVPPYHYGLVVRCGAPYRAIQSGLRCVPPIGSEVTLYPIARNPIEVKIEAIAKDDFRLEVVGLVQWQPRMELLKGVFAKQTENAVKDGIVGAACNVIGALIGRYKAEELEDKRGAAQLLINCLLRLDIAPHQQPFRWKNIFLEMADRHSKNGGSNEEFWLKNAKELFERHEKEFIAKLPKQSRKNAPEYFSRSVNGTEKEIEERHRLQFYSHFKREIEWFIQEKAESSCSPIERRHGVDIRAFAISSVLFSKDTQRVLELRTQRKREAAAAMELLKKKIKMMERLMKEGKIIDPQVALNAVDVTLGQRAAQAISITGNTEGQKFQFPIMPAGGKGGNKGGRGDE